MKTFALALATLVGVSLVGGAEAAAPKRGGVFEFAVGSEPPNYDCHATNSYSAVHLLAPHYSTLLKIDVSHYPDVTGDLAESWTVSEDRKTYTFKLRPNVKFHDGTPFTSADIKATYDRLRNPPSGVLSVRKAQLEDVAAVETPDPATVVFRLKDVNSAMLTILASPWNCVYSAAKLQQDLNFPADHVLGTGPFKFAEHVKGSYWRGERFDQYFVEGRPYLDGFRAVLFSNPSAMVNALQGGQVLAEFRGLSPAERDRLKQGAGDKIRIEEATWIVNYLVSFNVERKPFDDPRVRRALSLAIDRWGGEAGLSRTTTLKGVGTIVPPGSVYAASESDLAKYPGFGKDIRASREEAKRLLKEAGVANLSFTLTNLTLAQPRTAAGVFLIDQWRQIGVSVEHKLVENAPFNAALGSGNFDVVIDFISDYVDEPNLLFTKFLSWDKSPSNPTRAIDRTLDDLFEKQKRMADPTERLRLVRAFESRLLNEAYTVPLLWTQRIIPTNAVVKGYQMTPSHLLGQDLAGIWLDR
jgi:peptide/nickel transport system substrate-binding protein